MLGGPPAARTILEVHGRERGRQGRSRAACTSPHSALDISSSCVGGRSVSSRQEWPSEARRRHALADLSLAPCREASQRRRPGLVLAGPASRRGGGDLPAGELWPYRSPVRQLDSKESRRPRETLTPLSEALWLQIDTAFDNEQFRDLAHHLLSRPEFEKAAVVVCWHPPRGAGRCERRIVIVVRNHGE